MIVFNVVISCLLCSPPSAFLGGSHRIPNAITPPTRNRSNGFAQVSDNPADCEPEAECAPPASGCRIESPGESSNQKVNQREARCSSWVQTVDPDIGIPIGACFMYD